jgi:hypothetical protein
MPASTVHGTYAGSLGEPKEQHGRDRHEVEPDCRREDVREVRLNAERR